MSRPRALVIAGLDPSGGAGLVLDALVLGVLGYAPATVLTVATAQNSRDFLGAAPLDPAFVARQVESVAAEGAFACVKVGALGSAGVAGALAEALRRHVSPEVPVVLDPVLASSSGGDLTGGSIAAVEALARGAAVVTPNAREAAVLAASDAGSPEACGAVLAARWDTAVVVTSAGVPPESGVGSEASAAHGVELVCDEAGCRPIAHPLVTGVGDVRGTGCAFSSALAALLGRGLDLDEAVRGAQSVVGRLLRHTVALGRGRRQVDVAAVIAAGGWESNVIP